MFAPRRRAPHRALPRARSIAAALCVGLCLLALPVVGAAPVSAAPSTSGGTIRWGLDLTNTAAGAPVFDPTIAQAAAAEEAWEEPIYDSLLRVNAKGSLVPGLASSVTIADPETISIRLRSGVTFSDGAPFDAAAVKAGILRNMDAPNHGQFSAQLYDIASIDVASPTALTIHLSQPVAAAFYPLLASPETYIVSPKAAADPAVNLNTTPVGAGPFVLKQYIPNEQIVLVKNPTYFQASSIKIHEIDIVNTPSGPQQVNALESGLIDAGTVPLSDLQAMRSGSFEVHTVASPGLMTWIPICKTIAPFDNAKVRQALSYAVNRPAMDRAILEGTGPPQWSLWPQGSPLAPKSLDNYYAYNPTKARQLLRQAGFPHGLSVQMIVLPGVPVLQQVAQVLQQEWAAVGVKLTIEQSTNFVTDLYVNHSAPLGLISQMPAGPTGLLMVTRQFVPGAIGDLCNYDNPTLDGLATQLDGATPSSASSAALWNQAQQIIVKNALAIFLNALPIIEAADKNLRGNTWLPSTFQPVLDLWHVSVR